MHLPACIVTYFSGQMAVLTVRLVEGMCNAVQVVVDSDATAKALLSNGQLRNRVTIIPLNKVRVQGQAALQTHIKST